MKCEETLKHCQSCCILSASLPASFAGSDDAIASHPRSCALVFPTAFKRIGMHPCEDASGLSVEGRGAPHSKDRRSCVPSKGPARTQTHRGPVSISLDCWEAHLSAVVPFEICSVNTACKTWPMQPAGPKAFRYLPSIGLERRSFLGNPRQP